MSPSRFIGLRNKVLLCVTVFVHTKWQRHLDEIVGEGFTTPEPDIWFHQSRDGAQTPLLLFRITPLLLFLRFHKPLAGEPSRFYLHHCLFHETRLRILDAFSQAIRKQGSLLPPNPPIMD